MNISYPSHIELLDELSSQETGSLDFVVLITGALDTSDTPSLHCLLTEAVRVLKEGGNLFVQGILRVLPGIGVFLEKHLTFKYWFAVESTPLENQPLPSVHAGVLLFSKGRNFKIGRVRLPHQSCAACERSLKDWGGKAHLMNPDGYVVSDVIKDIPTADNYSQISEPLFDILIGLLDLPAKRNEADKKLVESRPSPISGFVGPVEGLAWKQSSLAESYVQYTLPDFPLSLQRRNGHHPKPITPKIDPDNLYNVIHQGDSLEILRQYPDESVDLVFADPPYNLDKAYSVYDDGLADQKYIEWCNDWLAEYARILKPTGSLFVLNLPRWAMHHAHFLNQHLYFQNWIVWDALSEPRGKIMPAHYALLFYTKQPTGFTFNYPSVSPIDARHYCLRASCVRQRKAAGDDDKAPLNDIWWDAHRIKHRRDRDIHPCQLPNSLMERIIRLSTNPGDVVLDAFGGAGTTPITALQLERRYVAMDLDPNYVEIMRKKVAQVHEKGEVRRQSIRQETRVVSKKALQLELRQLSVELGRLPTQEDVRRQSQYELAVFLETFPTWGKALKGAKLEMQIASL
ncbi:MAG TPA: DNA methyltransferase [Caldilineaceae bacterium]|nr:DNA methyltransferase [Caldilineaceae bacterium]